MTLALKHVTLTLSGQPLITNLSLTVTPGSILALMGASGCGKSSLLSFIAGTLGAPLESQGELWLNGVKINDTPVHKRGIGLQFQDHLLFPHMTVAENLAFGLPAGQSRAVRKARVKEALQACEMEHFGHHDPMTLSGGQRARISLMRTLLSEPAALLLDEPFSRLDPQMKKSFRSFVMGQIRRRAMATIMVTHDREDTVNADQLIQL